jgi:DnaJ homolog subfamily C member 28
MDWQMDANSLIDKQIEAARKNGTYDDVQAKGQKLDLNDDPYVPEEQRLAFKMLKDSGFAPAWIENDKAIRAMIDLETKKLEAAYRGFSEQKKRLDQRVDIDSIYAREALYKSWDQTCAHFRETAVKINKEIQDFNLTVPVVSLQRLRFDAEREIERIQAGKSRR